ncbi:hypothetical protein L0244_22440, partial [bacterium]|nr:hypothetical protein [bacterium]
VSDIDDIRSRLGRVASDIVGAIFSMSDFRDTAIREVEADRRREVLLFAAFEIRAIVNGETNLLNLITRKKDELRRFGHVWLFQRYVKTQSLIKLRSAKGLLCVNGKFLSALSSRSQNSNLLFALSIPDTRWGYSLGGQAVALNLHLDLINTKDLHQLLALIDERFGLSDTGSFSIHQSKASWFGFGAENFVKNVLQWEARYQQINLDNFHHSESFSYFDAFKDGWIFLTGQQRVNLRKSEFAYTDLIILLPGIPVDITPYLRLCRDTNNTEARFYNVGYHQLFSMRLKKHIRLETEGEIVSVGGEIHNLDTNVSGLIAQNPFFNNPKLQKELLNDKDNDLPYRELSSSEFLICDLLDWHDAGDIIDQYDLLRMEGFQVGNAFIIRPWCTWRNIIDPSGKNRKIPNRRRKFNQIKV